MAYFSKKFASALAGGAIFAMFCLPATAIDIGVDASVGGVDGDATASTTSNGGNASVSLGGGGTNGTGTASLGGSGGNANASIGGVNGTNGTGSASVGTSGGAANVTLGGLNGTNGTGTATLGTSGGAANVTIGGLNGLGLGANGTSGTTLGAGVGTAGITGTNNSNMPSAIANMTDTELARYKKTCKQVLGDSGGFDADLVALCKMVQTASR